MIKTLVAGAILSTGLFTGGALEAEEMKSDQKTENYEYIETIESSEVTSEVADGENVVDLIPNPDGENVVNLIPNPDGENVVDLIPNPDGENVVDLIPNPDGENVVDLIPNPDGENVVDLIPNPDDKK